MFGEPKPIDADKHGSFPEHPAGFDNIPASRSMRD